MIYANEFRLLSGYCIPNEVRIDAGLGHGGSAHEEQYLRPSTSNITYLRGEDHKKDDKEIDLPASM